MSHTRQIEGQSLFLMWICGCSGCGCVVVPDVDVWLFLTWICGCSWCGCVLSESQVAVDTRFLIIKRAAL